MELVQWLPESAAYRASSGPEGRRWSQLDSLLADMHDLLAVAASADTRLRKPVEYDRPRYPEPTPAPSSKAEVAAFFGMVYVPATDQEETVR